MNASPDARSWYSGTKERREGHMVLKTCQALFSIYLFLCGFLLAICVFMSSSDLSPELSLDLIHHPLRSILEIVVVFVPFVLIATVGVGGRWSWVAFRAIATGVVAFGIHLIVSNSGTSGALTGDEGLMRGTGWVIAISSILILAVSFKPGLRQRFIDGF
jgi:hypothetical protein